MSRTPLVCFLVLLGIFLFAFGGMAGCNCGDDDDDDDRMIDDDTADDDSIDDDATDDDATDDDATDDDATDDDATDDDDDDTVPDDVTIDPPPGQSDVALNDAVSIVADEPLDPALINFSLSDGETSVAGIEQFTADLLSFFFFPANLLEENTTYTVEFDYDGEPVATDFSTVEDAGEVDLIGNADATPGAAFALEVVLDEVLEPTGITALVQVLFSTTQLLIAPSFVDTGAKADGTVMFAGGEGADFDGDDIFELNHGALGIHLGGEITGDFVSLMGPFTFDLRGVSVEVELASFTGVVGEDGLGNPVIDDGLVSVATHDCENLATAFGFLSGLVDLICDEEAGLFFSASFHTEYRALGDLAFDPPVVAPDTIEVGFDPPLYTNYPGVQPLNTVFEVFQDGGLVLSSNDHPDAISFPDCCTEVEPDWYAFSNARFDIPVAAQLTPGDYTLRFLMGLHGLETAITVE